MTEDLLRSLAAQRWLPYRLAGGSNEPLVELVRAGERVFHTPFLGQAIEAGDERIRIPLHQFYASMDSPSDLAPPAGFLFHMSRSGSTLTANMLRAIPGCVVIAEAPLFAQLFRNITVSTSMFGTMVGNFITLFQLSLRKGGERLVVKFTSWHTAFIEWFASWYPTVNRCFLYRNPRDVLASMQRDPSNWWSPQTRSTASTLLSAGAESPVPPFFDLLRRAGYAPGMTDLEFYARLLGVLCRSGFQSCPDTLTVNYDALPEAAVTKVAPRFGLPVTAPIAEEMRARARYYSKDPTRTRIFTGDPGGDGTHADSEIRDLVARFVLPAFAPGHA